MRAGRSRRCASLRKTQRICGRALQRAIVGGRLYRDSKMAYSDSLTKWYMRRRYCMRANRSSSRQQTADRGRRLVPSGRLQWDCVEMSWLLSVAGFPPLRAGSSGRYSYVNARYAHPQLALFLPSIPVHTALLQYSTPCTILLPFYSVTNTEYTHPQTTDTTTPSFSPSSINTTPL